MSKKKYNIIYFYSEYDIAKSFGYTPLADIKTFEHYLELLDNENSFIMNFIPENKEYISGHLIFNNAEMQFQRQGSHILVHINNLATVDFLDKEHHFNQTNTSEIVSKLDLSSFNKNLNG